MIERLCLKKIGGRAEKKNKTTTRKTNKPQLLMSVLGFHTPTQAKMNAYPHTHANERKIYTRIRSD